MEAEVAERNTKRKSTSRVIVMKKQKKKPSEEVLCSDEDSPDKDNEQHVVPHAHSQEDVHVNTHALVKYMAGRQALYYAVW